MRPASRSLEHCGSVHFGLETGRYGSNFVLPPAGYSSEPSHQSIGLGFFATITVLHGCETEGRFMGARLCFSGFVWRKQPNGWRAAGMLFVVCLRAGAIRSFGTRGSGLRRVAEVTQAGGSLVESA